MSSPSALLNHPDKGWVGFTMRPTRFLPEVTVDSRTKSSIDILDRTVDRLHETEQQLQGFISTEVSQHLRCAGVLAPRPQFLRQATAIR